MSSSVKIGTLVLLLINLMFYGFLFIGSLSVLVADPVQQKEMFKQLPHRDENEIKFVKRLIYIYFIVTAILIPVEIMGLYGVLKKKPALLIPHMMTQILTLVPLGVLTLVSLIECILIPINLVIDSDRVHSNDFLKIPNVFLCSALTALQYYCFVVVHTHYKKLKKSNLPTQNVDLSASLAMKV